MQLPYLFPSSPESGTQQLELQVLGFGVASRLTSGLTGGGDSGLSKDKLEICAKVDGGAATWIGETETAALLKEAVGDRGTTAPPPPDPPPLPSRASLSRSR